VGSHVACPRARPGRRERAGRAPAEWGRLSSSRGRGASRRKSD